MPHDGAALINLFDNAPDILAPKKVRIEIQKRTGKTDDLFYWNWRWPKGKNPETNKYERGYDYGGEISTIPDQSVLHSYLEKQHRVLEN